MSAPDYLPRRTAQLIILGALLTGLFLGGSLSFPFWYGLIYYYASAPVKARLVTYLSPDSLPDIWHPLTIVGAVIWGLALARISGIRPLWRLGLAGGVGVFLGQLLWTFPAIDVQDALWPAVPPHIRFAREFVVGIGVAGGITALTKSSRVLASTVGRGVIANMAGASRSSDLGVAVLVSVEVSGAAGEEDSARMLWQLISNQTSRFTTMNILRRTKIVK